MKYCSPSASPPVARGKLVDPRVDTSRRRGFTLVELLVVITIITILAGLSLRVVMGMVNEGREAATKSTISKIQRILESRLQAFQRRYGNNDETTKVHLRNTLEWKISSYLQTKNSNGDYVGLDDNARLVVTRKLLYIKYFPQSAWEVDSALQPGLAAHVKTLTSGTPANNIESETSFSNATNPEVLYDLVIKAATIGDAAVGDDVFLASEFADTDNDGFPEFVDGWGKPIRFYRWPVLLFRPGFDPTKPTDLNQPVVATYAKALMASFPPTNQYENQLRRDPQDPLGLLGDIRDLAIGGDEITGLTPKRRVAIAGLHVPYTFHAPMVVSAGTDGEFGIYENVYGGKTGPDSTQGQYGFLGRVDLTNPDALQDNISSLRIRSGGR